MRVVELLTYALLLLGKGVKKVGFVLEGDECWESRGLKLSNRAV